MMKPIKVKYCGEYIKKYHNFTGCLIDKYNNIAWYKDGQLYREDGPAIEHTNGNKWWFKNGVKHREDGPAVVWSNGNKLWYLNNKKYDSEQDWKIAVRKMKLEKVLKQIDNENNTL